MIVNDCLGAINVIDIERTEVNLMLIIVTCIFCQTPDARHYYYHFVVINSIFCTFVCNFQPMIVKCSILVGHPYQKIVTNH